VRLIGIDCATKDNKVGVAAGTFESGCVFVDDVRLCTREKTAAITICEWIRSMDSPVLIAIDAPLGWPVAMGLTLSAHSAGQELTVIPNTMFRRATDRFIHQELGKTPLDVGADRIARTAHAALALLGMLRRELGVAIPLAWSADDLLGISAIEVYPAATLVAHGFRSTEYKKPTQIKERQELLVSLGRVASLRGGVPKMEENGDALDAAICLIAAADFMAGRALAPPDHVLAAREGWIWAPPFRKDSEGHRTRP
jgi:predicted RNase H-like nuclease